MILINKIDVLESQRIQAPFSVELRDLNILTGSNGSGKTTLLKAVTDCGKHKMDRESDTDIKAYRNPEFAKNDIPVYRLFMSELIDRHREYGFDLQFIAADWGTLSKSSGERAKSQINDIKDVENAIILIDEMDASLDWKNQASYCRRLKKLAKKNQVFVASHSFIVCSMAKTVFDMDTKTWIDFNEIKNKYLK